MKIITSEGGGWQIFELDRYQYLTSFFFFFLVWGLSNWELISKEQQIGMQRFQPEEKICLCPEGEIDKVQKWNLEGLLLLEDRGSL